MRAILLAAVLAGCLTPSLVTTPGSDAAAVEPFLVLSGCENLSGSFPVLSGDARAVLPAGFQPRAADLPTHAIFWIVSVRCDAARVDGVDVGEAWLSYGELDVVAPAHLRVAGVTEHTVPVFALAQPPAVADALRALGIAHVALSDVVAEPLAIGGKRISVRAEGGGFEMVGHPTTGTSALGAGEWGMFGVADRKVLSSVRGASTPGTAASGLLSQTSDGALPLMDGARPVVRGGAVTGFGLSFTRVS